MRRERNTLMNQRSARIRSRVDELLVAGDVVGPPVPVERLARQIGAQIKTEPFEGQLSGLLFRQQGRTVVGVNALHPKTRQRFTIAHELGHLLLHDREEMHVDRDYRVYLRDARASYATDLNEMESNSFAAELLMPAKFLAEDLRNQALDFEDDDQLRRLAERYKVSLQAMMFRLANLGYIHLQDEPSA